MTSAPCFVLPIWIFPAPTDATGFGLASFEVLPKTDLFPKVQMCRTNEVQDFSRVFEPPRNVAVLRGSDG